MLDALAPGFQPFIVPLDELRKRQTTKWSRYGADILPAFIAEMDFLPPEAVQAAIMEIVGRQDYGYPRLPAIGDAPLLSKAFSARMSKLYGWEPDPALAVPVSDLVQTIYACVAAFTESGDPVILQDPIYGPIRASIRTQERTQFEIAMKHDGRGPVHGWEELAKTLPRKARLFFLCHPHNPTGHAATREELHAVADFCIANDLIVVADEIHAELMHDGRMHVPLGSLGPEIAKRTITISSATKSFNIAGLRVGIMHFGSAALKEAFATRIPIQAMGAVNALGAAATLAAWTHGEAWLQSVKEQLHFARDRVRDVLAAELPGVTATRPDAGYLSWMDFSALGFAPPAQAVLLEKARVATSAGEEFSPRCTQFARLNFATSPEILEDILGRIVEACRLHA